MSQYSPTHQNKIAMGNIDALLTAATQIDKTFKTQPRYICRLPGGQLYYDSELQLDTDGWPEGAGKGDASWQAQTSLSYKNGAYINANIVPYIVLPGSASWIHDLGIALGDYAVVLHKGVVAFAVFADTGPSNKLGEGSLQLLRALGEERIKANGNVLNAGAGPGIVTIVFPGSGHKDDRKDETVLLKAIHQKGAELFGAIAT